jgi:signal transduction histidine kinase
VLADGRQVGRVCVLRDVTRFKELDTLKSEFVSTVSHDLRSPLTLMRGYATMLEMVGNLNEEQQKYLQRMSVGVDSMTRLVNNLLDLGRIEAGVDLNLEMVPLRRLLHKVVESLQVAAAHKQVELAVLFAEEAEPVVEADAGLIEQAVHNLVENAVKYTLEGGRVTAALRVVDGGQNAVIEVRDTGIGIAPPDQLRLFERFYRVAHRETRKQRGSGLGLAIVKSIVERHNGRVWVESELDRGSTFTVVLPLKQFQAE